MIQPLDLAQLRQIAEAATPGPWCIDKDYEQDYEQGIPYSEWPQTLCGPKNTQASQWVIEHGGEFHVDEISELTWPDAEFIAAFDPPTVLALIYRLEASEREAKAAKGALTQSIAERALDTHHAAGIAVDEAVKGVVKLIVEDPSRRAREAEARAEAAEEAVARVREACESEAYEVSNEHGAYDAVAVDNIIDALDGEQS